MKKEISVFIYGSLKKGFHNHQFLKNQRVYGTKMIRVNRLEKYPLYNSESYCEYFPYLEDRKGVGMIVKGELYQVKSLKELDRFEGVPDLYKRGTIEVQDKDGNRYEANAYFRAENLKDYRAVEFIESYEGWKKTQKRF